MCWKAPPSPGALTNYTHVTPRPRAQSTAAAQGFVRGDVVEAVEGAFVGQRGSVTWVAEVDGLPRIYSINFDGGVMGNVLGHNLRMVEAYIAPEAPY